MAADDDVSLPDLEVIAQFSLAVRSATAPRAQVIAALEADLAALRGESRPRRAAPAKAPGRRTTAPTRARPQEPEPEVEAAVQAAAKAPARVARPRTPRAQA